MEKIDSSNKKLFSRILLDSKYFVVDVGRCLDQTLLEVLQQRILDVSTEPLSKERSNLWGRLSKLSINLSRAEVLQVLEQSKIKLDKRSQGTLSGVFVLAMKQKFLTWKIRDLLANDKRGVSFSKELNAWRTDWQVAEGIKRVLNQSPIWKLSNLVRRGKETNYKGWPPPLRKLEPLIKLGQEMLSEDNVDPRWKVKHLYLRELAKLIEGVEGTSEVYDLLGQLVVHFDGEPDSDWHALVDGELKKEKAFTGLNFFSKYKGIWNRSIGSLLPGAKKEKDTICDYLDLKRRLLKTWLDWCVQASTFGEDLHEKGHNLFINRLRQIAQFDGAWALEDLERTIEYGRRGDLRFGSSAIRAVLSTLFLYRDVLKSMHMGVALPLKRLAIEEYTAIFGEALEIDVRRTRNPYKCQLVMQQKIEKHLDQLEALIPLRKQAWGVAKDYLAPDDIKNGIETLDKEAMELKKHRQITRNAFSNGKKPGFIRHCPKTPNLNQVAEELEGMCGQIGLVHKILMAGAIMGLQSDILTIGEMSIGKSLVEQELASIKAYEELMAMEPEKVEKADIPKFFTVKEEETKPFTVKPVEKKVDEKVQPANPLEYLEKLEELVLRAPVISTKQFAKFGQISRLEEQFHLYQLQAGFDLYARSILKGDIADLATILPGFVRDLHVIPEQRMKRELLAQGKEYLPIHDLREIAKQLSEEKRLEKRLIEGFYNGLSWARYGASYLRRKERPFGLQLMEVAYKLLEGKPVDPKRLIELNNELIAHLTPFYPNSKQTMEALQKQLNQCLAKGYKAVKPAPHLPQKSKPRSYVQARIHHLSFARARDLLNKHKRPFSQGYLLCLFSTHVQYGKERSLAARVEAERLGSAWGHRWERFAKLLGEKLKPSAFEAGKGLHYPHYSLTVEKAPRVVELLLKMVSYSRDYRGCPVGFQKLGKTVPQPNIKSLLTEGTQLLAQSSKNLQKLHK